MTATIAQPIGQDGQGGEPAQRGGHAVDERSLRIPDIGVDLLPIEIIQKKKHGFGIPVATWIRSDPRMRELSRDVLLSARAFARGYFRKPFIEDLFRKHDAFYVPTLVTYRALSAEGSKYGLPADSQHKVSDVLEHGLAAVTDSPQP